MNLGAMFAATSASVVVSALALFQNGQSQSERPVFVARADAVRVPVVVRDGRTPVTGLDSRHFRLTDNGVVQVISSALEVSRLDLVLLIDASYSIGEQASLRLLNLARHVVKHAAPIDKVTIVTFSDGASRRAGPSSDENELVHALASIEPRSPSLTAMWDAVAMTSAALTSASGRAVVFVFTDGCDNGSWLTPSDVAQWLGRTEVTVDMVFYGRDPRESKTLRLWTMDGCVGPLQLPDAIGPTGGVVHETGSTSIEKQLEDRLAVLRSTYLLTYSPTSAPGRGGWHKIEVTLQGARGRVTARPGYFSDPPK